MGLHSITPEGHISWHCHAPHCSHHNCTDMVCAHHSDLPQDQRPAGEPQSAHITHEAIQWQPDGQLVALPVCDDPGCTRQLFVKAVFTDEEITQLDKAIEMREESTVQVVDKDHEALRTALATHGIDIAQKIKLVKQRRVLGYHRHPMLDRHLELAQQLRAIGKLPPEEQGKQHDEDKDPEA